MATAAVFSAIKRVKNKTDLEQQKRDIAMAKYERRLTRMENRQLNLLEDLENFEAMGNVELPTALLSPGRDSTQSLEFSKTPDNHSSPAMEDLDITRLSGKTEVQSLAEKAIDLHQSTEDDALSYQSYVRRNRDTSFLSDLNYLLKDKKLPNQEKIKLWYYMRVTQIAVAVFIILNFLLSAIKAQRQPTTHGELYAFEVLEIVFALIFALELAVNMYGNWCRPFFVSGWNWFDLVIVFISLFTLGVGSDSGIPGINTLRLFRAFRVIRLFKRIPSLKRIVEGVIQSLPGVGNAFIVLTLIMAIWSILGVEFYSKISPENFGTFSQGMFSMFQCMTMDSWSGIARPLIKNGPMHWFFFCSYVLIAGIIMVNVVVAVLLENFIGATGKRWGKKDGSLSEDSTAQELADDDIMMDRLLFLELEFVKVNDKLDALVSSLLDQDKQNDLQETLTEQRSKSFLRTRTGRLAMKKASKNHEVQGTHSTNVNRRNWFIRAVDEGY